MSTNSILSKIRQEIERRLNILTNVYAEQVERKDEEMMNYYHGKVIALEELRPFLDTLSEEPDKSLEEAAEEYIKNGRYLPEAFFVRPAFIAGAEWQKSQMMKDAVEGEVMTNGFYPYEPRIVAPYPNCPYAFGDKVKAIVLKEEE